MPTRGSDKHSPRVDDQLEQEAEGLIRGEEPTRVREEREQEPTVSDEGEPVTPDPEPLEEEEGTGPGEGWSASS
jgi:hypothetical protein